MLGVGASLADEVAANTGLRTAPSAPVSSVYSGVLYDALGWSSLSTSAKRRAGRRLVVASALWGAVRFGDRIPAYRLSMDTTLPGIGPLAAYWREPLAKALGSAVDGQLVVDCRSTTYAAAWKPPRDVADRVVAVRVFREAAGRRTVVSHMAKHTRGEVARHLLERAGRDPGTPGGLADAVAEAFDCELTEPGRVGSPWTLDVIVRD